MIYTNTIELTEKQRLDLYNLVEKKLYKTFDEMLTNHLSIDGTKLNLKTMNYQVGMTFGNDHVYTILIDLNKYKKGLIKSFFIIKQED